MTHSTSNLSQFVQSAEEQGFNLLPNRVAGQGIIAAYLQGNTSAPMSAAQYAQAVHQEYVKDKPYVTPLPRRQPAQVRAAGLGGTGAAGQVEPGSSVFASGQVIVQQLEYLLAAVGALMLVLRRRAPVLARQVGLFSLATLLLLVATRLSGTIAAAYNGERAVLQSMVVLVIATCWPLSVLTDRARRWLPAASAAVGAALAVMFVEQQRPRRSRARRRDGDQPRQQRRRLRAVLHDRAGTGRGPVAGRGRSAGPARLRRPVRAASADRHDRDRPRD